MSKKLFLGISIIGLLLFATACNRNYYAGNGSKKGKNCGCPNVR